MKYYPPVCVEGNVAVVEPPAAVAEEGAKLWSSCLGGQFVDQPPPFHRTKYMVDTLWKKVGKVEVLSNEDGMFIFKLASVDDCDKILQDCWHVDGKPLFLRKWKPQVQPIKFKMERLPLWIKLYNVPTHYWTTDGLCYLSSGIGIPLQLDKITEERSRLKYARVCVEVDLKKELVDKISLRMDNGEKAEVIVEYAWKPRICNKRKGLGHSEAFCKVVPAWRAKNPQPLNYNCIIRPQESDCLSALNTPAF